MTRTGRRTLIRSAIGLAGVGLLAGCERPSVPWPSLLKKVPRLGFLAPNAPPPNASAQAFLDGLRDLGYVDGETIRIEFRWAEDREERLPALAAELVALQVDVIYGWNTVASQAAKRATSTIPIVFAPANDPIGAGLVTSLARPGGNATGPKFSNEGLTAKRLEILKDAVPGPVRVGALGYAAGLATEQDWQEAQAAERQLGLSLRRYDVRAVEDFEQALDLMTREGAEALFTLGDSFIARNAARLVPLSARHRLPGMFEHRVYPDAGGLMSYGPNIAAGHRRAATYVDKILKGARPADLPVEQASVIDFVVNLKSAQALGLVIPQAVLAQTTELIQ